MKSSMLFIVAAAMFAAPMAIAQAPPPLHPIIISSPTFHPFIPLPDSVRIDLLQAQVTKLENEVKTLQGQVTYVSGFVEPQEPGRTCKFVGTLNPNDILSNTATNIGKSPAQPYVLGDNMMLIRCTI